MFEEYTEKRLKLIKHEWKKYLNTKEAENLHEMRVEVKKLVAILHFIQFSDADFDFNKHHKLPAYLMDISGELRDQDVFDALAEKFDLKVTLLQHQIEQYENQQAVQKLQAYYQKHHTLLTQTKKALSPYLEKLTSTKLRKHMEEEWKKIVDRLQNGVAKEDLHDMRKQIKSLVYLQKLAQKNSIRLSLLPGADKLNELQEQIGQWHDVVKFDKRYKEQKMVRVVKKVSDAIHEEREKLRTKINRLSQEIVQQAMEEVG